MIIMGHLLVKKKYVFLNQISWLPVHFRYIRLGSVLSSHIIPKQSWASIKLLYKLCTPFLWFFWCFEICWTLTMFWTSLHFPCPSLSHSQPAGIRLLLQPTTVLGVLISWLSHSHASVKFTGKEVHTLEWFTLDLSWIAADGLIFLSSLF